ncbi:MAG TPA: hypothetical protein VFM90_02375 [Cyclobacteriaceae bacterium]|nr:hypothetical protein [Cyclobacteriaceae bacterium]
MGSVLVPLLMSFFFKNSTFKHLPYLRAILIVSLVCDAAGYIVAINGFANNWIGNFFILGQSLLLIKIFGEEFKEKRIALFISVAYLIFFTVNIAFFQGWFMLNTASFILTCFIVSGYSLYYFYRLLSDMPVVYIHRLPMLWLAFAVLLYHAGNFFLILAMPYFIDENGRGYSVLWSYVHNMLNITKNILFAIALWHSYQATKSRTSL